MLDKVTALVPMKGISERVKNKNVRSFCGSPLMCVILKTLTSIDIIDKIVVNTDSEEIKDIASKYNKVIIHNRPKEICGNHIPMNKLLNMIFPYWMESILCKLTVQIHCFWGSQ